MLLYLWLTESALGHGIPMAGPLGSGKMPSLNPLAFVLVPDSNRGTSGSIACESLELQLEY